MNDQLKSKFPEWVNDNSANYVLAVGDDLDSLFTACLLQKIKGYEVNWFYDFNNLYGIEKTSKSAIGCDMALTKGRCWDNHVTLQNGQSQPNNRSANINSIFKIHRGNYTDKYCMSTLLTVYSYYGLPLPKSDIGKMLLLCVDSGYLGHYNDFFKSVHNSYIEQLELNPLLDVLNKYGKKDFEDLKKRYKTDGKIKLNRNRILETDINLVEMQGFFDVELSLPKQKFYGHTKMKRNSGYIDQTKPVGEVFSFALTGKNYASYTVKEKV